MLADLVLVAAAVLVAGWETVCLTDLARAERVRFLPRWAWAVARLFQEAEQVRRKAAVGWSVAC